jgi:HK97 family phage major capsid protein
MTETVDPTFLQARKAQIRAAAQDMLLEARAQGRDTLTAAEAARHAEALDELRGIDDEIRRCSAINNSGLLASLRQTSPQRSAARGGDDNLVYRRHDRRTSWVRDLMAHSLNRDETGEARSRLARHAAEVATEPAYLEYRDISRVDGQGGYAVPPAWLMDQYIELARPGRAFANLVQRQALPGGTDSINIPKLLTGTTVGVQTADNTQVSETDLTDTFINAPVRTIAGAQSVAIQLIDQSPIAFDDVVFRDLVAAHAAVTDTQVLAGSGTGGQVLGVNNTPGITTIAVSALTIQGIYSALANAIQQIHSTRFLPPEVIVMHPRRWGWLLSLLDTAGRPLFIPNAGGPFNAAGILTDVDSQQIVGTTHGLPIVTDPNITTTAGGSPGGQDVIYVARVSDLVLWESGIRARVLPEVKAANLTVVLQIFNYFAFTAGRHPQSVVEITGLTAPTF